MNVSIIIQSQLLATKFFVPVAPGTHISRPRLTSLLQESLKYPLTVISAPAGFGKTMLLSAWVQSLPAKQPPVAWVSLDEEDNEPHLFWTYVLSALDQQQPELFTPLLKYLQSPQTPPLKYILATLSNLLLNSAQHFVLILDDYHLITEPQVHANLMHLLEHLPPQLHIILATRTDPPLSLPLLRARGHVLEIRTDLLRCTTQETRAFFKEVINIQFPDEIIQKVAARTEGWLVSLQLLALSQQGCANSATLLEEISGDQRYILDYLTEEVLERQQQDMRTFLLSTCILERLNASLCDAVIQQSGSQQMLERLEHANLFVVALDTKREWYRYHALFAQALHSHLEQTQSDLALVLHHRASLWYAEHDQTTEAILHAFRAREWQWAADLIERKSLQLMSLTWGTAQHAHVVLQGWIEQLPAEVLYLRPQLCLACTQLLWITAPYTQLEAWLDAAEATLTASLSQYLDEDISSTALPLETSLKQEQERQQQQNQLGEVITFRAVVRSHEEEAQTTLPLCQQALTLLSAENHAARAFIGYVQLRALYLSTANDAVAAVQSGLQAVSHVQAAGKTTLAIGAIGATATFMIGTGRLHEIDRLTRQAMQMATQPGGQVSPEVCWPAIWQAEILREWNQLDAASELIEEALLLSPQTASIVSINYSLYGYAMLLRIALSRGELDRGRSALLQFDNISMNLNQPSSIHFRSLFTTVDQIRLWLASGELDHATHWAKTLDLQGRRGTPLAYEREEVACTRILLAKQQPTPALQRLEPILQRATTGQRWGHVIEIRILQALAHQMRHEEMQALQALAQAVRLAEPEGYIRSFVDEGALIAALLSKFQEMQRTDGPTPYLDMVLSAFPQQSKPQKRLLKHTRIAHKEVSVKNPGF